MPLEYGWPNSIATLLRLAAFTGFFAFVLTFLTMLNVKYVLSILEDQLIIV
jgi:hypothetical protein